MVAAAGHGDGAVVGYDGGSLVAARLPGMSAAARRPGRTALGCRVAA